MKFNLPLYIVIVLVLIVNNTLGQQFTNLKGECLDQIPPGNIPVVFAPGIVSTDTTIEHGSPTFSPDGKEVFWQSNYRKSGEKTKIFGMTMKCINNKWTLPEISPYGSGFSFSTDGKRLYFNSKEIDGAICYIEKEGANWSKVKNLGLINCFPELKFAYNISFTNNGTLYFLGHAEGLGTKNNFGIYKSELVNGTYSKPELLPSSINTAEGFLNWTPFIAPDESYLLFSSNRHSPKTDMGDIYISFRNSDNKWNEPVRLSDEVNSNRQERFPSVSPDGKYLFFTRWVERGNEDVMWVSAEIIERLREKNVKE
jgi:hypothetical protein